MRDLSGCDRLPRSSIAKLHDVVPARCAWASGISRSLCVILLVAHVMVQAGCRVLRSRDTRDLSSARQLSLRGAILLQQRKNAEAESLFVESLRLSPGDERAQWGYAEVLWSRGEHDQATKHMVRAVELSGSNPDLLVRLGQMHLVQGDFAQASEKAEAALKGHRNNPSAWALKADGLRSRGEVDAAIDAYHRALIYRPDWPEVQVTVAELYRLSNRPQRALATVERLFDQRSASQIPPRAHLLRGQALADLGERESALMCLRQAAPTLNAEQGDLLLEIAQTQCQLGDLVEARLCIGRVLMTDPNNSDALKLQGELEDRFARHNAPNITNLPIMR